MLMETSPTRCQYPLQMNVWFYPINKSDGYFLFENPHDLVKGRNFQRSRFFVFVGRLCDETKIT